MTSTTKAGSRRAQETSPASAPSELKRVRITRVDNPYEPLRAVKITRIDPAPIEESETEPVQPPLLGAEFRSMMARLESVDPEFEALMARGLPGGSPFNVTNPYVITATPPQPITASSSSPKTFDISFRLHKDGSVVLSRTMALDHGRFWLYRFVTSALRFGQCEWVHGGPDHVDRTDMLSLGRRLEASLDLWPHGRITDTETVLKKPHPHIDGQVATFTGLSCFGPFHMVVTRLVYIGGNRTEVISLSGVVTGHHPG